jgi:transposase InsO family protein
MVNKFTKGIKAKPITKASQGTAIEFIKEIMHRYSVMNTIITDNRIQFTGSDFIDFYNEYLINVRWASVAHLRTNGQIERANGSILRGLKPRMFRKLNRFGTRWIEELQPILWGLRTTPT